MNRSHTSQQQAWPQFKHRLHATAHSGHVEEGGRRLSTISNTHTQIAISFLTVVKNRHTTIGRTINSILNQHNSMVEHIIVDGLSTDGTMEIIRRHSNDIEYYASRTDRNLYQAINDGIELCRGRYICIINSDDWLTRGSIKYVLADIESISSNTAEPIFCYGAWKYTEHKKPKLWQPQNPRLGDYFHCTDLCHNAMYIPKSAYQSIGPYDDTYQVIADTKWILSAVEKSIPFKFNIFPTCFYSMDGISSNGNLHWNECLRLILERFPHLSSHQAEGLLNRFYAFKGNIPANRQTSLSEREFASLSNFEQIAGFIDSAKSDPESEKNSPHKWVLNFKKLIWRIQNSQII